MYPTTPLRPLSITNINTKLTENCSNHLAFPEGAIEFPLVGQSRMAWRTRGSGFRSRIEPGDLSCLTRHGRSLSPGYIRIHVFVPYIQYLPILPTSNKQKKSELKIAAGDSIYHAMLATPRMNPRPNPVKKKNIQRMNEKYHPRYMYSKHSPLLL